MEGAGQRSRQRSGREVRAGRRLWCRIDQGGGGCGVVPPRPTTPPTRPSGAAPACQTETASSPAPRPILWPELGRILHPTPDTIDKVSELRRGDRLQKVRCKQKFKRVKDNICISNVGNNLGNRSLSRPNYRHEVAMKRLKKTASRLRNISAQYYHRFIRHELYLPKYWMVRA